MIVRLKRDEQISKIRIVFLAISESVQHVRKVLNSYRRGRVLPHEWKRTLIACFKRKIDEYNLGKYRAVAFLIQGKRKTALLHVSSIANLRMNKDERIKPNPVLGHTVLTFTRALPSKTKHISEQQLVVVK